MYDRDMRYDGRRMPPRNSRGEFMSRGRGRGRRGDRGMDYGYDGRTIRSYPTIDRRGDYGEDMRGDMRRGDYGDMNYDMARGGQGGRGRGNRGRGDYGDYADMRGGDGHYMHGRQSGYEPVEFMGYCQGYYGSPEHDYGRGGDYGYDMRGRRDYGYDDYGYRDYGDYGETLSDKELEHWEKKLMEQLDDRERQIFGKEQIMQRVKAMGKSMSGFGEKEMYVTTLMIYTDYKNDIGQNPDLAVKLAYDWLADKDVAVKGAEKLAVYHDCVVEGE